MGYVLPSVLQDPRRVIKGAQDAASIALLRRLVELGAWLRPRTSLQPLCTKPLSKDRCASPFEISVSVFHLFPVSLQCAKPSFGASFLEHSSFIETLSYQVSWGALCHASFCAVVCALCVCIARRESFKDFQPGPKPPSSIQMRWLFCNYHSVNYSIFRSFRIHSTVYE